MFTLLASLISIACANSTYVGFSRGNNLVATPVQGQVRVSCEGFNGLGAASYECRDVVLEPQPYDYFLGPRQANGNRLELTATREDGVSRNKIVGYNGATGSSTESVNLWISTIFQKPLLSFGKNVVNFKIYSAQDSRTVVSQGNIQVIVQRGAARQCPVAQYISQDSNDCSSQYSICQRYFSEFQNCR